MQTLRHIRNALDLEDVEFCKLRISLARATLDPKDGRGTVTLRMYLIRNGLQLQAHSTYVQ